MKSSNDVGRGDIGVIVVEK